MTEIEVKPEHAADPNTRRVGILVGVVGILLSVVTIASHRAHTEAVIHRTESNDQWAFYQAKKIRENTSDVALTLLQTLEPDQPKAEASKPTPAGKPLTKASTPATTPYGSVAATTDGKAG